MKRWLGLTCGVVLVGIVGCGDDTSATGGSGAGGAGTGAGGPGGGGASATGGGGAATGGAGGAAATGIGAPCAIDADCDGGLCLTEAATGWAGGYCSALCAAGMVACAAGATCTPLGDAEVCLLSCADAGDCGGTSQTCAPVIDADGMDATVCVGGCDADAQCAEACDADLGLCAPAEDCMNGVDDDGDGLHDCAEIDCAADAACTTGVTTACGGAIALADGVAASNDTTGGTDFFAAQCGFPIGLGKERVYSFSAPGAGVLVLDATPASGDLGLYVRTTCADGTTQLACTDSAGAGGAEHLELDVAMGDALTIFADAYDAGTEGPFQIVADFQALVCGDGTLVGAEQCDDANMQSGDGCSATCTMEAATYCASNAVGVLTAITGASGSTASGTKGFAGSCGGVGREKLFRFTPLLSGTATFTLTPTDPDADLLLYARSTCSDDQAAAELGCKDLAGPGSGETLAVPVVGGTPVTVFVDSFSGTSAGSFNLSVAVQ